MIDGTDLRNKPMAHYNPTFVIPQFKEPTMENNMLKSCILTKQIKYFIDGSVASRNINAVPPAMNGQYHS